ncbi:MAG: selenocysteine-specific translation elongation factor [Anaerolineales bacterium]|nr:selenocysteine-specific translation elongation factor [Anaerolineales bacterium]
MRVLGTAGHVDHGKSTLIEALTGKHPDRLKEEQAREMTIELGFGWMALPNGEEVGLVDVPGHRDFISAMLAGVGGIDAALLIIAADEGLMPQTKEHLAILDLLQISGGVIVVTKTDLASDSGRLALLETDIRSAVSATVLRDAPIVRVSAKNKSGLPELLAAIENILRQQPARPNLNRPRLPIDRVFSLSGFGTVVTGTLLNGQFSIGDEATILPSGQSGRVRGIQTHNKKVDVALPGSRVAINLTGIDVEAIRRGATLVKKDSPDYQPTRRLDAQFHLLADTSHPLKHAAEVKLFIGASETMATARLLDAEELQPGQTGWVQLELREPMIAAYGDRYVLRRPSPSETLGGGLIIDPHPRGRHKRFEQTILSALETRAQGAPREVLLEAALALQIASIQEVILRAQLEEIHALQTLEELLHDGTLIALETGTNFGDLRVTPRAQWNSIADNFLKIVNAYHASQPLRVGIPREELKSKLKLAPRVFSASLALLKKEGLLEEAQGWIKICGREIGFTKRDQAQVAALTRRFDLNPFSPPSVKEAQAEVGEELFNALVHTGRLIAVSSEVVFQKQDYEKMAGLVYDILKQEGAITLAEVRNRLGTSRKYAQALLEYLDLTGVTLREGDTRKLRETA